MMMMIGVKDTALYYRSFDMIIITVKEIFNSEGNRPNGRCLKNSKLVKN